jgi:iron(III) transport system permease protein
VAVVVEKLIMRGHHASITERSRPLSLGRHALRDRAALVYALVVCGAIASVVGIVVVASFVTLWPYNLGMSLRHYRFEVQNGIAPLGTSVVVSLMAAGIGVVVTVAAACVSRWLRPLAGHALYFMSVLPAAVPGMVLGLGYLLLFNDPANPLGFLYGTLLILALCNVYHYHAQGYLIAATSVGQVSRVFDETSTCLGGSAMRTLRAVILPIIAPTLAAIAVFFFVRSMVTLSAVIFLVTPATQLAAVSVLLLDDSGSHNQAAAFSVCIMAIVGAALALFHGLLRAVPALRGTRR